MEELMSIIDRGIKNFSTFKKKDLIKLRDLFLEDKLKNGRLIIEIKGVEKLKKIN